MTISFPYWEELRGGEPRFLPLIPIEVVGPVETIGVTALVDSGAEHNVFGLNVAEQLGIDLTDAAPVEVVGIGQQREPGNLSAVTLRVHDHEWKAPTIFTSAADGQAILGQIGFFGYFDVTFGYRRREIELNWSEPAK